MGWSFSAALVTGLCAFAAGTSLQAYPAPVDFSGKITRWNIGPDDAPISYEIKADDDNDKRIYGVFADEAAEMWSQINTSYFHFTPVVEGETAQMTVELKRTYADARFSAGYTIFDQTDAKGPVHCSIYIGMVNNADTQVFAKTVLHEMGHCVGLGHSLVPEAIMSYSLDANDFALSVDDRAAVARLYPLDGGPAKVPPGCSVGSERAGNRLPVLLILLVPLALAINRKAPRRQSETEKNQEMSVSRPI